MEKNVNKPRWYASNYSYKEKILYVRDRIMLPSRLNKQSFEEVCTHSQVFDTSNAIDFKIAFLGDVMPFKPKQLGLDDHLRESLKGLDVLVVNLEGIITSKKRYLALSHHKRILDTIRDLSDAPEIIINVCNNHAGDFGMDAYARSLKLISDRGFRIIGNKDNPYLDLKGFRFFPSSVWSNQMFKEINRFTYTEEKKIEAFFNLEKYNIFLPHWGYEMQLYPTEEQVEFPKKINNWDLIVGNHSHVPQPCSIDTKKKNKRLIAYSLGNFCYSHYNPNHYCSAILTTSFSTGKIRPQMINYKYQLTEMHPSPDELHIKSIQKLEYAKLRKKKLIPFYD